MSELNEDAPRQDYVQGTNEIVSETLRVIGDLREKETLQRVYRENPYLIVGVAAGAGYLAAGGLFTPFTRRVLKIGMKALFVPIAAAQLKKLTISGVSTGEE